MGLRSADFRLSVPLMSKARPRTPRGGGRPYMPKAYMEWKARVRAILAEWWTIPPLDKVRRLVLVFHGPARGDLDNLAGAVLDAGNGLIWRDDRVTVIPAQSTRFVRASRDDQSIHLRVIW